MNKKIYYIIFILISFISFNYDIYALEKAGYISCEVMTETLNLRDAIDGNVKNKVTCGVDLTILDENAGSSSLCDKWYKVKYNNVEYYACGDWISIREELSEEDEKEYRNYLKGLGFPDSYRWGCDI